MALSKFLYADNKPIIGKSSLLRRVLSTVIQLADSMIPVLILGETGTGKELIARAVHYYGPRKNRPFIVVNCAAIPEKLAESELFGHEKGAFTDATQLQPGKFELACGGTIFLDEVKELSLKVQAKLLRVLQEKQFFRVGGRQPVMVDVRVICATNSELFQAVQEKSFRKDLFYRLRGAQLKLPSLWERKEDLPLLIKHFLEKYNNQEGTNVTGYSKETLELLTAYSWPGNIRELENVIWNAVLIRKYGEIRPEDIDLADVPHTDNKIEIDVPAGRIDFHEFVEMVTGTVAKQLVRASLARFGNTTLARDLPVMPVDTDTSRSYSPREGTILVDLSEEDEGWYWIVNGEEKWVLKSKKSIALTISKILINQIGLGWVPHETFLNQLSCFKEWDAKRYFGEDGHECKMQKQLNIFRNNLGIEIKFSKSKGIKFPSNVVKSK